MNMSNLIKLTEIEQWEELLEASSTKPALVFKHSTRCNVSADAHDEFMTYLGHANPNYTYALVNVLESRPVSDRISESLQVKHQSPQALVIKNGEAVWHDSHWRITESKLKEILG
jgi:bacillithiol system protein YtxJ